MTHSFVVFLFNANFRPGLPNRGSNFHPSELRRSCEILRNKLITNIKHICRSKTLSKICRPSVSFICYFYVKIWLFGLMISKWPLLLIVSGRKLIHDKIFSSCRCICRCCRCCCRREFEANPYQDTTKKRT